MNTVATSTAISIQGTTARSRALLALLTFVFGIGLYIGAGFAAPALLHNATHDTRHAFGLPCH